ncbi:hypothetical protein C943_00903 [Mariniradius saccharolyticus AK6]|uniref:Uncharacterized protein n=1 Tax=Mariniradius saccharolyticus AK6 TaxID=1239962 RepID=M7Y6P6_9BACT|nr:hypothetical protein C943_00903 [Mariniradius saccharolyticus AK6]
MSICGICGSLIFTTDDTDFHRLDSFRWKRMIHEFDGIPFG